MVSTFPPLNIKGGKKVQTTIFLFLLVMYFANMVGVKGFLMSELSGCDED